MVTKDENREGLISLVKPAREFKKQTYVKGRCAGTSIRFAKLCNNKYGGNVEVLRYSEKSGVSHVVNVHGDIVVDWTVRQFLGYENAPYPFIYRLGKDEVFGGIPYRNGDELEIRRTGG